MKLKKRVIALTLCLALLSAISAGIATSLRDQVSSSESYFLACIEPPHNDRH